MINLESTSRTVLVVEDSPEDFEALKRGLLSAGMKNPIHHCDDGDSALDYLAEVEGHDRPMLILLDLNLPGTDGLTVLKEIKASPKLAHVPVVILTTSESQLDLKACYAAGANSYMQKPVNLKGFMDSLQRFTSFWIDVAQYPS